MKSFGLIFFVVVFTIPTKNLHSKELISVMQVNIFIPEAI